MTCRLTIVCLGCSRFALIARGGAEHATDYVLVVGSLDQCRDTAAHFRAHPPVALRDAA